MFLRKWQGRQKNLHPRITARWYTFYVMKRNSGNLPIGMAILGSTLAVMVFGILLVGLGKTAKNHDR